MIVNILTIHLLLLIFDIYLYSPISSSIQKSVFFSLPCSHITLLLSQVSNDEGNFILNLEDASNLIYWKKLTLGIRSPEFKFHPDLCVADDGGASYLTFVALISHL